MASEMNGYEEQLYGSVAVMKETGISSRQLYYWVNVLHVVEPQRRQHRTRRYLRFTAGDIHKLKKVRRKLKHGYTLRAAAKVVSQRERCV